MDTNYTPSPRAVLLADGGVTLYGLPDDRLARAIVFLHDLAARRGALPLGVRLTAAWWLLTAGC